MFIASPFESGIARQPIDSTTFFLEGPMMNIAQRAKPTAAPAAEPIAACTIRALSHPYQTEPKAALLSPARTRDVARPQSLTGLGRLMCAQCPLGFHHHRWQAVRAVRASELASFARRRGGWGYLIDSVCFNCPSAQTTQHSPLLSPVRPNPRPW